MVYPCPECPSLNVVLGVDAPLNKQIKDPHFFKNLQIHVLKIFHNVVPIVENSL